MTHGHEIKDKQLLLWFSEVLQSVARQIKHARTHKCMHSQLAVSCNVNAFDHTYTQRAVPHRVNTHNCPSLSLLDTYSLLV